MRHTLLVLLLTACGPAELTPEPTSEPAAEPVTEEARKPLWPDPASPTDARYAASHILIAYRGAADAPATTTRSAPDAKALAADLFEQARSGTSFEQLAKEHSDGPSAPRGGRLGTFLTGTMVPAFEAAAAGVAVGEHTVVETPYGWHVVRRDLVEHAVVQHIVVGYAGAHESTATRTLEEAQLLIQTAQERIDGGEAFEDVARDLSEDPAASTGGHLGAFGRGQMIPAFEDAAFALQASQTSKPVVTPYGVHIVRRIE